MLFINEIKAMNKRMNIQTSFKEIQKQDIKTMSKHADNEANPLYPVPKLMNAKELEKFYYKVSDWSDN